MTAGCAWCCAGTFLLICVVLGFLFSLAGAFRPVNCDTEVLAEVMNEQHISVQTTVSDGDEGYSSWPWVCLAAVSFDFEGTSSNRNLSTVCDSKLEAGLWRTPNSMAVCFKGSPATSECKLSDGSNVTFQSRQAYSRWMVAVIVFGSTLGPCFLALVMLALLRSQQCAACLPLCTNQPATEFEKVRDQHQAVHPTTTTTDPPELLEKSGSKPPKGWSVLEVSS